LWCAARIILAARRARGQISLTAGEIYFVVDGSFVTSRTILIQTPFQLSPMGSSSPFGQRWRAIDLTWIRPKEEQDVHLSVFLLVHCPRRRTSDNVPEVAGSRPARHRQWFPERAAFRIEPQWHNRADFDVSLPNFFWQYDNQGQKNVQLRFYQGLC
jgi:hypothetical protein